MLKIGGWLPFTTLDYPQHLACVVFCQGCAWRCDYCHNPELISPSATSQFSWSDILAFLHKRQGLLQAVVFSGGEATLQPKLAQAMQQVAALGFKVGLHTAGIKPKALAKVLPWCDWVGLDIKAPYGQAAAITGVAHSDQPNWESLALVLASQVAYECRTTVHWSQLSPTAVLQLAQQLKAQGVQNFCLQLARTTSALPLEAQTAPSQSELAQLEQHLATLFKQFELRA